jgi:hypothetical protein
MMRLLLCAVKESMEWLIGQRRSLDQEKMRMEKTKFHPRARVGIATEEYRMPPMPLAAVQKNAI